MRLTQDQLANGNIMMIGGRTKFMKNLKVLFTFSPPHNFFFTQRRLQFKEDFLLLPSMMMIDDNDIFQRTWANLGLQLKGPTWAYSFFIFYFF